MIGVYQLLAKAKCPVAWFERVCGHVPAASWASVHDEGEVLERIKLALANKGAPVEPWQVRTVRR